MTIDLKENRHADISESGDVILERNGERFTLDREEFARIAVIRKELLK